MAVVWGIVAAALGLAASRLLQRSRRGTGLIRHRVRFVAALVASIWAVAFAAGAIGAVVSGDNNPKLPAMMLATLVSAWLLWRGPERHLGVAGHWLAGAWLAYGAVISGHSPISGLYTVVAFLALFAAGMSATEGGDADQGPR